MNTTGKPSFFISFIALATFVVLGIACQPATNSNANLSTNANTTAANLNANVATTMAGIATREPERYRATLVFTVETEGQRAVGIPPLSADVARNGTDRRVSFKLPDGSDFIYLEKAGLHIAISPARRQYAELTPEATGVQLQKLMTPGQLAERLGNLKGVERVGEETVNGRLADKYRYATTRRTGTQAGEVSAEAFVMVDKETGLPLRAELFTEASGDVQGVKGAKIVAEMRDISTDVDSSLFEVPAGYSKVPPEQVRQQINALASAAAAIAKSLLGTTVQASPATSPSPMATSPR